MYYVSPYSCHALFCHSMRILYYSFVNHKKSKHSCDISLEVEFSLFSYFQSHTGNIKPHWNWSTGVSLPLLRTLKWKLQGFLGFQNLENWWELAQIFNFCRVSQMWKSYLWLLKSYFYSRMDLQTLFWMMTNSH